MPDLVAGKAVSVADGVLRVLAPNPSVFTGPGTNTYVLGRRELVVLDPGPADPAHLDAIRAAVDGRPVRAIVCTHTHEDHSPGAAPLARLTGAVVVGSAAPDDGFNDLTFRPAHTPGDNEIVAYGDVALRAITTPGHVSNHLCFLLESQQLLFTGDHLIQGSTVVIVPPEGSMRDYLDSLERLRRHDLATIAPGHGDLMPDPLRVIETTSRHRLAREGKTLRALRELGRASIDELLPCVYDDVPAFMHAIARLSLQAHLIKLVDDGVIGVDGKTWIA